MTHTILHVGDIHLCGRHPRNQDRLNALDQIVRTAEHCDTLAAVVIPGDLFHEKSAPTDRNDLANRLQQFGDLAPVLMVAGNHDEPEGLEIFARLEAKWAIVVMTRPQVVHVRTPTGITVACFGLPWPHRAGLVAAGVEHQQVGQTARELLEPIFMAAAASIEESTAEGALPLMIGHATIGGAVASTGQPQIGQSGIELDPSLLARLGDIYKGFSHIHKHQTVHGAVYAGSVARLDFAEREDKGFIEVEYQRDGDRWEHRWRFVPLDVPRMIDVVGRLSREAFVIQEIDGESADGIDPGIIRGADCRVRFSYRKSEIGTLDVAKIHAEFAEARSLKLDPVPEIDHEVRAPEIAAAVTLEAKLDAFCVLNRIPVTALVREALTALQAKDRDALLADVRAFAAAAGVVDQVALMSEVA